MIYKSKGCSIELSNIKEIIMLKFIVLSLILSSSLPLTHY